MDKEQQMRAPVYEALEKLKKRRVVPFDVPGHKRGRGNPELVELLGEKCVSLDVIRFLRSRKRRNLPRRHFARNMHFLWLAEPLPQFREWCFPAVRQGIRSFCREMCTRV